METLTAQLEQHARNALRDWDADPATDRDKTVALGDRLAEVVRQQLANKEVMRVAAMETLWAIFNPGFAPLTPEHPDRAYYYAMGCELVDSGWRPAA